jgi:hypothetical protein
LKDDCENQTHQHKCAQGYKQGLSDKIKLVAINFKVERGFEHYHHKPNNSEYTKQGHNVEFAHWKSIEIEGSPDDNSGSGKQKHRGDIGACGNEVIEVRKDNEAANQTH